MVSPLVGRVSLNQGVNMHRIWSVPDDNPELTVLLDFCIEIYLIKHLLK